MENEGNINQAPVRESKKRGKQIVKTAILALSAGVIFLAGFGVGSGRIILSKDQLYRKSQQKDLKNDLDYASAEELYDTLRKDFDGQLDVQKLLDGLKAGLAGATGDPYTEYLTQQEAKEFDEQLNGTFSGIGAELSKDDKGNLIVISPISGFPAEKAGLKSKDVIIEINGESTTGLSVSQAVTKIRGEKGTKVKLRVVRNSAQDLSFDITRETITIPSVESKIVSGNIGYLKISRFSDDTVKLATAAANDFKSKNVKGVVLDVRSNPGGLLNASVGVSSLWLSPGKLVLQEKRGDTVIRNFTASGNAVLKDIPTVVLINEGSASASEILAGALRDNGAARVMGVKSFGKGSVQQLEKLQDGSVLKVTIAKWFTPNGVNINKDGIKPDTEVKRSEDDIKAQKDPQLEAAQKSLQ